MWSICQSTHRMRFRMKRESDAAWVRCQLLRYASLASIKRSQMLMNSAVSSAHWGEVLGQLLHMAAHLLEPTVVRPVARRTSMVSVFDSK